ncbi:MAG: Sec-independent protein translocase subunit TatA [Steroidobacteraceae bacterium]
MGIGFRELLIILVIALVLFGAKKLKNVGSDLGSAVRGFKKAVSEGEDEQNKQLTDLTGGTEKDAEFKERSPASSDSDRKTG